MAHTKRKKYTNKCPRCEKWHDTDNEGQELCDICRTADTCIIDRIDALAQGLGLPIVSTAAALTSGVNMMLCGAPNSGKTQVMLCTMAGLKIISNPPLNVMDDQDRWTRGVFQNEEIRQRIQGFRHMIACIDDWSTIAGDKHQLTNLADVFIKLSDVGKTGDAMTKFWSVKVDWAGFVYGVQPKWFTKLRGSKAKGTDAPIRELWDSHFRQKIVRYWMLANKPMREPIENMVEFAKTISQIIKDSWRTFAPDKTELKYLMRTKAFKQLVIACRVQQGEIRGFKSAKKLTLGMLRFMEPKQAKKWIAKLATRIWIEGHIIELHEFGVTVHWGEYYILSFALRVRGGVTKDYIRNETGISMDTIENWIDGAVKLGWVKKIAGKNSRPRLFIRPTENILAKLKEGVPLKPTEGTD